MSKIGRYILVLQCLFRVWLLGNYSININNVVSLDMSLNTATLYPRDKWLVRMWHKLYFNSLKLSTISVCNHLLNAGVQGSQTMTFGLHHLQTMTQTKLYLTKTAYSWKRWIWSDKDTDNFKMHIKFTQHLVFSSICFQTQASILS